MKYSDSVVIIGGGLSSVIIADKLIDSRLNISVTIIEKNVDQLYKGIAYSSNLHYQPLNVVAGKMSLTNNKDHFVNWLKTKPEFHENQNIEKEFISRSIYGQYIEWFASCELKNIKIIINEVVDISINYNRKIIKFVDNSELEANYIILATGNQNPLQLSGSDNFSGFLTNQAYIADVKHLLKFKKIVIVGSGLTSVDILCSLYHEGYQNQIIVVSRHGKFPLVHLENPKKENEIDLSKILDVQPIIREYFLFIRNFIRKHKELEWQDVIDSIRPYIVELWKKLETDERKIFIRKLQNYWEIHRHRMPAKSALLINQMLSSGIVTLIKGNVYKIYDHSIYLKSHFDMITKIEADCIINCTGPNVKINSLSGLYANLLKKSLISTDQLELGIKLLEDGEVISDNFQKNSGIFAIGLLRKALDYECLALRELKIQASEINIGIRRKIIAKQLFPNEFEFDEYVDYVFKMPNQYFLQLVNHEKIIENKYTRTLLSSGKFCVFMLVWGKNSETSLHDHAQMKTCVKLLSGKLKETNYYYRRKLEKLGFQIVIENNVFTEEPLDIHKVECIECDYAVTIHITDGIANNLQGVRLFDENTRRIGLLNSTAKVSSWSEPDSAFEKVFYY